jgi:GTP cyclohydrolase II
MSSGEDKPAIVAPRKPLRKAKRIALTSHPGSYGPKPLPIVWGAADPALRGPVIGTLSNPTHRNVIGTHAGAYALYRALAVAAGNLDPDRRADLSMTSPTSAIGPHKAWADPERIVALDPWGGLVSEAWKGLLAEGYDLRPTIAVTQANISLPELRDAIEAGRLQPDGVLLKDNGEVRVTKAAIEPVWYLPGVARRFGLTEAELRHGLFEHTAGMFPELVTRSDLEVFLPPIGGHTIYMFGKVETISDPNVPLAVRVHDECNGSDVFGSDICTCRPYLAHGIETCVATAQKGGAGVIVYNRKEGRALGEVTKFLVYNARKRQPGGDRAEAYFQRTECVAGVQDMRFQELMPDVLHWLGITRIHHFVSMSNMKYGALIKSGIEVMERVPIPDGLIPADAQVEMDAKKAAGYFTDGAIPDAATLARNKGRGLSE